MSDFGEWKTIVARKPHRCDYCYGPIQAGETYSRWTGVFDGRFQSNAMHPECEENFLDSGDDEYTPGEAPMPERVLAAMKEQPR
jgi:hypothetical protein